MGYDVIGDIHGQADKLEALLRKLGYLHRASGWVPPHDRQAVFLGDLIDRGPDQVKVVNAVRSMIDAGHARSVMGNHEFNAIGYATPRRDAPGERLQLRVIGLSAQHPFTRCLTDVLERSTPPLDGRTTNHYTLFTRRGSR